MRVPCLSDHQAHRLQKSDRRLHCGRQVNFLPKTALLLQDLQEIFRSYQNLRMACQLEQGLRAGLGGQRLDHFVMMQLQQGGQPPVFIGG